MATPDLLSHGFPVEGYACLFDVPDLGRDLVLRGAFAASLARQGAAGVRMLYQHDPAEPIGVWTDLIEDGRGLYARGRLSPAVGRAREVASLIRDGALDGLSIGFKAVEARTDPRTRLRRIARIDLWEVSIVTFPMQPQARIARKTDEARIARKANEVRIARKTEEARIGRQSDDARNADDARLPPPAPSPAARLTAATARLRAVAGA